MSNDKTIQTFLNCYTFPYDAALVTHKQRPGSYGFIDSLDPIRVIWEEGGRKSRAWNQHGPYSEPEEVKLEDLEHVTCPDCGEGECWCGVGR